MPEFQYTDLLPLGADATEYRLLSTDGISTQLAFGKEFLQVDPAVLTMLTREAMRDIAHLLRPGHLRQLGPSWTTRRPLRTTGSWPSTCCRTRASRPAACCPCARTPAPRS